MTTEQKKLSKSSSTANNPVIMVVDKDRQFLENTKKYFLMRGYSIHSVHDVRAILTRIKLDKPNIIIMEANLGEIRCDSVIKMLQNKNINLPIIVTSQTVDKKFISGLKEFKISLFLLKPIDLDKLEITIRAMFTPSTPDKKKLHQPSILFLSEKEAVKEDPYVFIPQEVIGMNGFRIIPATAIQDSIEAFKKPNNRIKLVLVDATNEASTKSKMKLFDIIRVKLKLPVFFIAKKISENLKNSLKKSGFTTIISQSETSPEELLRVFRSALDKGKGVDTKSKSKYPQNILEELKTIKELPPMPEVLLKVEKLATDPNVTSAHFGKVLETDPSITARLLQLSNSSFYSFNRNITTVKDTISLMGIREVMSLVRLSCIKENLKVPAEIEAAVRKIWEHSTTCAITAGLLYEKMNFSKESDLTDILFMSGVIHDLGKIVLWKYFTSTYMSLTLQPDVAAYPEASDEQKHLGVTHCEVGRELTQFWELPPIFTNMIEYHHTPSHENASDLAIIIHISDILAKYIMDIIPEDRIKFSPEILEKINLTDKRILGLAHQLASVVKKKSFEATRMVTSL